MTPCTFPGCPRADTHANGGCWEHCGGSDLRPGAECEHGQFARKCDRCEDAQEIAWLRAELAAVLDTATAALKTTNDERDALRTQIARLQSLANINPDVPLVEALRTLGEKP